MWDVRVPRQRAGRYGAYGPRTAQIRALHAPAFDIPTVSAQIIAGILAAIGETTATAELAFGRAVRRDPREWKNGLARRHTQQGCHC